jgi:hypothetical protein
MDIGMTPSYTGPRDKDDGQMHDNGKEIKFQTPNTQYEWSSIRHVLCGTVILQSASSLEDPNLDREE